MNSINFIIKSRINVKTFPKTFRYYSSSDKDNKETKSENKSDENKKEKSEEALKKLNLLLQNMVQEDVLIKTTEKINLAKPKSQRKMHKDPDPVEERTEVSLEKKLTKAVKDVAQTIDQDVKQTESELLLKLLTTVDSKTSKQSSSNLSDIVKGMKIDRETKPTVEKSRAEQVRQILHRMQDSDVRRSTQERRPRRLPQTQRPNIVLENIILFGSTGLGIFKNSENLKESSPNKTYQALLQRDLKLAVTHPPSNYYQQMIQWTEEGKIWKFPINNEDQLGEELNVSFTEHVFLEKHLESWCPAKGPVRHFMELVCVGLSKNPYLTAQAKREHIEWFKNYFEDKKKILVETGAIPPPVGEIESGKSKPKVDETVN